MAYKHFEAIEKHAALLGVLTAVMVSIGVRVVVPHNSDNAPCYQAVSKTDATCVHCRSGIMAHNNGKCPQ